MLHCTRYSNRKSCKSVGQNCDVSCVWNVGLGKWKIQNEGGIRKT